MGTIKAIETQYKGYRFRSRLEARWAVFFDALEVEWDYESEGYDLSQNGKYLPDFKIFTKDRKPCFVEIKGEPIYRQHKNIYMAGEISSSKDDWRHTSSPIYLSSIDEYKKNLKYPRSNHTWGGYFYRGPYAIDLWDGHGHTDYDKEGIILAGALDQIVMSDIFFAWINDLSRFGTIAEIGFAYSCKKMGLIEIWIGIPKDLDVSDLWFVLSMADKVGKGNTPYEAFKEVDNSFHKDELKCAALSKESDIPVILLSGNPGEQDHHASLFRRGELAIAGGTLYYLRANNILSVTTRGYKILDENEFLNKAYAAARAARFEHGEMP